MLTDVINDEGGAATYNINFQQGTIERLEVGKAEGATFVTGDGNTVQSNSPGAKITDTENFFSANNSPGAVVGSGNAVSGNTVSSVVDYGEHTRTIEDWRNFYQGQPGAEELARRLGELERLMKEGTPGSAQKSRVRSLVTDLAVVLQSYPAMVQIVQQIGRLAA